MAIADEIVREMLSLFPQTRLPVIRLAMPVGYCVGARFLVLDLEQECRSIISDGFQKGERIGGPVPVSRDTFIDEV